MYPIKWPEKVCCRLNEWSTHTSFLPSNVCQEKRGAGTFCLVYFFLWGLNKIFEGGDDSLRQLFTWLMSSSSAEQARINDQIVPDLSSGPRGQQQAQKTLRFSKGRR